MIKDFIWGAAISAAQTESASDTDGKGPSIWDEFCKREKSFFRKDHIRNKHQLADSSDFYNHYKTDIDNLVAIGFKHFRFSIAWARVLPDGQNINIQGVQFYSGVIDYCLEKGITPWVTLYHWDLPKALEDKGGWTNRMILVWFLHYAKVCLENFPTVKNWIILNEPSVFVSAGYLFGIHAPGKKGFDNFFKATHHAMLCIGHIYRYMKQVNPELNIGSSFSFTDIEGLDEKKKNMNAALTADLLINRFFFEPLLGLGYPDGNLKKLKEIQKNILPGDLELLPVRLDFIGVQTYTREIFSYSRFNFFLKIKHVPAYKRTLDLTAMNWEIHPESIYNTLMKLHSYGLNIPLIVTENGAAFEDKMIFNRVNDYQRIFYYKTHIQAVLNARSHGASVKGYFAWSLIDNFEWAEGYHPRFGLIYVDFVTKKRILKQSAYWFKEFLKP